MSEVEEEESVEETLSDLGDKTNCFTLKIKNERLKSSGAKKGDF